MFTCRSASHRRNRTRGVGGNAAPRTFLLAASIVALVSANGVAVAGEGPVIDKRGVWTLTRLGLDKQTIMGDPGAERLVKTVRFRLPEGARQGGSTWYLLRYHFRLVIAPDSGSGRIYVGASTNDRASAQIRFDVDRAGSRVSVVSHELGFVAGSQTRAATSLTQEFHFANFLQYKGVKPGINTLSFEVEQYAQAKFRSLTVSPDSGIELSALGPSEVTMTVAVPRRNIEVGEAFELVVDLKNRRGRSPGSATVRLALPSGLTARTGASMTLRWPEGKRAIRATFRLRSSRAGRHGVGVSAVTPVTRPTTSVAIAILPSSAPGQSWWEAALLAGAVLVAAIGVAVLRRSTRDR